MEMHATALTAIALTATVALAIGLLLARLRQPPLVGYILVGIVLGPTGIGLIASTQRVELLAELGVLLLLFLLGMQLSLRAVRPVMRVAVLCTLLQILLSLVVAFGLGTLLGWTGRQAVLMGFIVSVGSTAFALAMLEDIGELRTQTGRVTIGLLVAQNFAMIPMLLVVASMGPGVAAGFDIGTRLAVGLLLIAGTVWMLGRRHRLLLPTGALMCARPEVITVAALAFCFTAATFAGLLGLSAAYGAFLAGLIIGGSTDRKPIMAATRPIQGLVTLVFFLALGLMTDLGYVWDSLAEILVVLILAVGVKITLNVGALRLLGEPWERAFPAGVIMGQLGEFPFVLASAGVAAGAIDYEAYRLAVAVIAVSLLLSPLWLITTRRFHDIAEQEGISSLRSALGEVYQGELTALGRAGEAGRQAAAWSRRTWPRVASRFARRREQPQVTLLPPPDGFESDEQQQSPPAPGTDAEPGPDRPRDG